MIYEKMLQTENSDSLRTAWTEYREKLTGYVYNCVEDYYRRVYLAASGKLRSHTFSLPQYLADTDTKPVIAIWGAGRCNDIDLKRLAEIAKLVLIDREIEWVEQAKKRYFLTDEQCVCVDVGFWEIYEEEEQFFEKLLLQGDDEHLSLYLKQLMDSISEQIPEYLEYGKLFDFSVVCGVASQLNARFAAMLHIYETDRKAYPKTVEMLRRMNHQASKKLYDAVAETTKTFLICANELYAGLPQKVDVLSEYADQWTEDWEMHLHTKEIKSSDDFCQVAGSREFIQEIERSQREGSLELRHRCGMVWPFSQEKCYLMDVLTAQFVNKIKKI